MLRLNIILKWYKDPYEALILYKERTVLRCPEIKEN